MTQFRAKYGSKLKKLDEQKRKEAREATLQAEAAKAAQTVVAGSITTNVRVTRRMAKSSGGEGHTAPPTTTTTSATASATTTSVVGGWSKMKYKELQAECKRQVN